MSAVPAVAEGNGAPGGTSSTNSSLNGSNDAVAVDVRPSSGSKAPETRAMPHIASVPGELAALAHSKARADRMQLLELAGETRNGQDNKRLMQKIADRLHRVGVTFPSVEVRWQGLTVDVDVPSGGNRVTTLTSALVDMGKGLAAPLMKAGATGLKRRVLLNNVNGVLRPGRMTLLLGPPGSGKTTLMRALAGQLAASSPMLRIAGDVTYNGLVPGADFVVERAATFVSQIDTHIPEMTVAETMSFASESMGNGVYTELFNEVRAREAAQDITPDPAIEAMLAASAGNPRHNIMVEYMARLLGIDHVMDTVVGDDLLKGISGGQKRRTTIGEMVVGMAQVMFLDEISNGLDSSAALAIAKGLRNVCTFTNVTMLVSLLQPAPEVYDCFDDVMVMSHGRIVFQGPREEVVPFFSSLHFAVPVTATVADFLQEVTNQSDQHRFWSKQDAPWQWTPPLQLKQAFEASAVGQDMQKRLQSPPHSHELQHLALHNTQYSQTFWQMLMGSFRREVLLIMRGKVVALASIFQIVLMAFIASTTFLRLGKTTFTDANMFMSIIFFSLTNFVMGGFNYVPIFCKRLPVFFKQRDHHFYTGGVYAISTALMRVPDILISASIFCIMVYFSAGFTVDAGLFFIFWLGCIACAIFSSCFFLFLGALTRSDVMAQGLGAVGFMLMVAVSGFVIARSTIPGWWIWLYWATPLSYIFRAICISEMTSSDWDAPSEPYGGQPGQDLGNYALTYRGFYTDFKWVWIGIGTEFGFAILFTYLTALALIYLPPPAGNKPPPPHDGPDDYTEEELKPIKKSKSSGLESLHDASKSVAIGMHLKAPVAVAVTAGNKDATLAPNHSGASPTFQPVTMVFKDVCYFVPKPKGDGELQLLNDISGSFRPGVLTALMGASGAGKTTLMDVLAGRKTAGRTTGQQLLNGHPKNMSTFARVMGYVEQFDVHTPQATVLESLIFSARLRLKGASTMSKGEMMAVVEEMMDVVELRPLAGAAVGMPGSGLSTEARKRLTIAVELVASPSLVFMDEPTSGLDARAASLVMRAVRNTVHTGRTVVCTIHQPNRQIFEAFDELLLLKPGGRTIFSGPLGDGGSNLVSYFQAIPGVAKYEAHFNPANWMLDVTAPAMEREMGVDFAELWNNSEAARVNNFLIEQRSALGELPDPEMAIAAAEKAATAQIVSRENEVTPLGQFQLLVWRGLQVQWRNPAYNLLRMIVTLCVGLIFGSLFWDQGMKRSTLLGVINILGALYASNIFMGITNCLIVMPVVYTARTVFYREKASRMYNPYIFAVAQGVSELPFLIVQGVVYSVIIYYLIQFEFTAVKFCWFMLFVLLNLGIFTFLGMGFMNLMPNVTVATALTSLFIMLWNLFCGFLQPKDEIRPWWIWAYYFNPATYSIYGCVVTQLGDVTDEFIDTGSAGIMSVAEYVESSYSYKYSFRGWLVLILVGFLMASRAMSLIGLRYLNFQIR